MAAPGSRGAVCQWAAKLSTLSKALEPKVRVTVAIDETKLNGRPLYVWAAVDVETKEL